MRGVLQFRMRCAPRFDYARASTTFYQEGDTVVFRSRGTDGLALRLRASVPMRVADGEASAEFELAPGKSAPSSLRTRPTGGKCGGGLDYVTTAFKEVSDYWRQWVARSTYRGRWRDIVKRSSLALKLLTFLRSMAPLSPPPTSGLPEEMGGVRELGLPLHLDPRRRLYRLFAACGSATPRKRLPSCAG